MNLNQSNLATESALQIIIKLKVNLLVIQEPWLIQTLNQDQDYTNTWLTLYSSFIQILLANRSHRPCTLVYISSTFCLLVSLAAILPTDPDLLVLDIIKGKSKIQLLNVYNKDSQSGNGPWTLEQVLYSYILTPNSLVLGNFNIYYP